MVIPATAIVPLLSASGVQSQTFMPFVLLGAIVVLVVLLLAVFGRQRRHRNQHHDHEE
ncbi:hypothetical protein [Amnibacterium setariae]|uniref:hypothetical protein n=1 Tax=Amnibacterium setariae TaxID=2306585 RepID=UPI00131448D7|nr:hypothetical protein [Amnibacterium setariae]